MNEQHIEQWQRWEPISGLSEKYYVMSVEDSFTLFELRLCDVQDPTKQLRVFCHDSVDAYSCAATTARQNTLKRLAAEYGNNFCTQWTFFMVLNSSYVQQLSAQSHEFYRAQWFSHFVIIGTNMMIEMVNNTNFPPQVEWITVD
jgi:hypothetical protein